MVETFTPPLFQVESLERGGLKGFIKLVLFRNLQEVKAVWGGGDSMVWSKPSPPLSFKLNHWKGGDSRVYILVLFRNLQEGSLGGGGLDGLVETFTPPLFQVESLERGGPEGLYWVPIVKVFTLGSYLNLKEGRLGGDLVFKYLINVKPSPFDFGS